MFWAGNLTVAYAFAVHLLRDTAADDAEADALRGSLYGMTNVVQSAGLLVAAPTAGFIIHLAHNNYSGMFLVATLASYVTVGVMLQIRRKQASP
ncbi:MAG: hypothetical protein K6T78_03435 [Alicyclobacillus sp.]|nr:hypothetical protein [Alicyclobacillus sp.]